VFQRVTRPLTLLAVAAGLVSLAPATSHAFPTEHVAIKLTVGSSYGATAHVTGGTATEIFNITIVRAGVVGADATGIPTVAPSAACTGVNDCTIPGSAALDPNLPATFVVHIVGGPRDLPDNVFDAYVQVTACTTSSSCTSSPVILSLG
jgi:hypothetical protein